MLLETESEARLVNKSCKQVAWSGTPLELLLKAMSTACLLQELKVLVEWLVARQVTRS